MNKKIRVLIIDDSPTIRRLLTNILGRSPYIEIIDSACDANDARRKIKHYDPDVVTLDIEMPGMDGLTFLDRIMRLRPMPVVMCSTLTHKGAESTLKALSLGAVDFVAKPTQDVASQLEDYADEFVAKIRVAAKVKFDKPAPTSQMAMKIVKKRTHPKLVAIGSSTGGPAALEKILMQMPKDGPPIVIAQHIPQGFSEAFATRVSQMAAINIKEAEEGDSLQPGEALIAPGGKHLRLEMCSGRYICHIDECKDRYRHKPSVDYLFRSLMDVPPSLLVAVMLTGMGGDGAEAMLELHKKGVHTIAQDEASSVVWGMPKRAVQLGAISEIVGLDHMTEKILEHAY